MVRYFLVMVLAFFVSTGCASRQTVNVAEPRGLVHYASDVRNVKLIDRLYMEGSVSRVVVTDILGNVDADDATVTFDIVCAEECEQVRRTLLGAVRPAFLRYPDATPGCWGPYFLEIFVGDDILRLDYYDGLGWCVRPSSQYAGMLYAPELDEAIDDILKKRGHAGFTAWQLERRRWWGVRQ